MNKQWLRGSEWRKWDLHLHAPGTKLNDQFTIPNGSVWDAYCQILYESDVHAFGITDYFSADGYFSARKQYRRRYPLTTKFFLPNIELRTNDVVNIAQEEVNVHLIFNPIRADHEEKIRSFLQSLKTNKTDSEGRNVKASELKHTRHFAEATTTRAFIQEALEETYGKAAVLRDYVLIVTAANNDGIRPIRGKMRKLVITDELDKLSNAFFGNSANVEYFLNTDRAEDTTQYAPPKPVLSGCDAHSFRELEYGLGQTISDASDGIVLQPTWIKADLTFEGFKQIIFEPQNRVYIGNEPEIEQRVREHKTRYIKSLHLNSIENYRGQHGVWFSDKRIPIGKELVAIIGNKGSGKSAVTDVMGLLGNSHKQISSNTNRNTEELFSFLNKHKFLKKGCANNFTGTLYWHDGQPDQNSLGATVAGNLPEKVEYLPQKYLERLCANVDDDEFRKTLNKVIFRYVKPAQRHGQDDLDDLIKFLTQQADEDIKTSKHALHSANERVVSTEKKLAADYRRELNAKVSLKMQELTAHQSNRPPEISAPPTVDSNAPSAEAKEIEEFSQHIIDCNRMIKQLEEEQQSTTHIGERLHHVKQSIQQRADNLTVLKSEYEQLLTPLGISFNDIVQLRLDYSSLDALIAQKDQRLIEIGQLLALKEDISAKFADQQNREAGIADAESKSIVCRRSRLEHKKNILVERQDKPVREYQLYLQELEGWKTRENELNGDAQIPAPDSLIGLRKELDKMQTFYPNALDLARADQLRISKEMLRKKRDLKRFYDAIKQSIDAEIEKSREDLGDYSISIEAALRFDPAFFDNFLWFINQAKRGSFHGIEEGRANLRSYFDSVSDWESEAEVFDAVSKIVEALHFDNRDTLSSTDDRKRDIFEQMINQRLPVVDLYNYLFGFDYLNTKYDLKVDQKDLSELSPGERGGLLLIFYLMLDRRHIPLIIDQPEDNLDNKSVYEVLVKFIKQAKKRRQIILVTHNPNLAVVADAEQLIHVSIDKTDGKNEFDFFSGSIENSRINRAVVDILEGTMPAFDNRRLKYRR